MKKVYGFLLFTVIFCLISCSNPQQLILTSEEDTLRNELKIKAENIKWTNEIEAELLTAKIDQPVNSSNKDYISPQMLSTIQELQKAVYPELKNYASLDSSQMNTLLFSTVDKFCKELCKGTENIYPYFDSNYIFNYVFFKNDFEPVVKALKTKDYLFEKYFICKAFESQELNQVPLRFYNSQDYIDLSVYLTYHNGYKITQIEVIRWGKTYGEAEKE